MAIYMYIKSYKNFHENRFCALLSLPSGTEKGAIRAGNVDFTLHCCISITDKVKINNLQK